MLLRRLTQSHLTLVAFRNYRETTRLGNIQTNRRTSGLRLSRRYRTTSLDSGVYDRDASNYANVCQTNWRLPRYCDEMSGRSRSPSDSAGSNLFGAVELKATVKHPRTLKDLSMSEKFNLAEERTRLAGLGRRATDYPWHKRIAVSDDITRRQTSSSDPTSHRQMELTAVNDQVNGNEEFFENLLKKMTQEQFVPGQNDVRSRKRTCLWNKENSSSSGTGKRRKEGRRNGRSNVPRIAPFARRLLPPQTDVNRSAVTTMKPQGDQTVPRQKLTLDLIQEDINMRDLNSNMRRVSSSDAPRSSIESFSDRPSVDNCTGTCKKYVFELQPGNRFVNNADRSADHDRGYVRKYPNNFWTSPCLSTIEEYHEPSSVDAPLTIAAIGMEYAPDVRITPPLPTELVDCMACRVNEAKGEDNPDFSHLEVLRFPDVNLFT